MFASGPGLARLHLWSQQISGLGQSKAEQIFSTPFRRVECVWISFAHADSPDAISRTCFNQYLWSRSKKKVLYFFVLRELRQIGIYNNFGAFCFPNCRFEILHLPAKCLGLLRRFAGKDFFEHFRIAEEHCFLSHHVMLCGWIDLTIDLKSCREPLAETTVSD